MREERKRERVTTFLKLANEKQISPSPAHMEHIHTHMHIQTYATSFPYLPSSAFSLLPPPPMVCLPCQTRNWNFNMRKRGAGNVREKMGKGVRKGKQWGYH